MTSNSRKISLNVVRLMADTMVYKRNPDAALHPIHPMKYFIIIFPPQFLLFDFKFTGNMIHLFPGFFHLSQLIVLCEIECLDEPVCSAFYVLEAA